MSSLFCAGCRLEKHTDHLAADADGYYWCEPCHPDLFATRAPTMTATPRKPQK